MKITESSPELVSKTRTGKNKFWQGHVVTDGSAWYTQTSYWQTNKDGVTSKVQWSDPYEATPKNLGKSNETSAEDQAHSEFDSMVTKQRDKGYAEVGVKSTIRPLPMLAQKFSERGEKMQWPVWVQPKYNGQRMLFDGTSAWSRGGKDIIPECIAHIIPLFPMVTDIIDGELILPDNVLLQKTMSATKKYVSGVSEQLIYRVYDVVLVDMPFSQRLEVLKEYVKNCTGKNVVLASTYIAHTPAEVMKYHKQFVAQGYEGTMVRDDSEGYVIKHRSNQLQKYKDFLDAEFKIVDIKDGNGKFKGAAIIKCDNGFGATFDCTPEGSMEYRRELYTDRQKHIGRYLTVRYQELSKDNIPIFPIGVDIRDKEDFL